MKTMTKWQLPLLAVATLFVAACDPYPATDKSTPTVVRVVTSGSAYVEVDGAAVANPAAIAVAGVSADSLLYIQFNKDVDGSSIQAAPNYDANHDPVPPSTACALGGSPLNLAGGAAFPAGTLVCYLPSAPTDGGQIYVQPGAQGLRLGLGAYTVAGTVRDYQGQGVTIGVNFNVLDELVAADASDTSVAPAVYEIDLSWPGWMTNATTYQIERAPNVPGTVTPPVPDAPGTFAVIATGVPTTIAGKYATYADTTVAAATKYWYRVSTEAPATAHTYPIAYASTP